MELYEKIKEIRQSEKLGRTLFSKEIDIPMKTIEGLEQKKRDPSGKLLKAICEHYPQYTLWLMTDKTEPEHGQISPESKIAVLSD